LARLRAGDFQSQMMTFQQRLESAYPSETYANTLRALRHRLR
jgi:hypothetical protein